MESNRDEAEKCIKIAAQAFKEYKTQRAKNFIKKAEKLYPSQDAKDLLMKVLEFDNEQQVYRILRCENHYEVLEVSRDATHNDIVEAYKRLVLLVHPDKNRTNDAHDAFIKMGEAKNVLVDPFRRSEYDLSISDYTPHQPFEDDDPSEFEDDVNVEEFNNRNDLCEDLSFPKCRSWWETKNGQFILAAHPLILLILIPAAIMGLSFGVTLILRPSQIFSLTPDENFTVRRRTMAGKISYYVTINYAAELREFYEGSLAKLEKEVKLAYACEKEKDYKQSEIKAAENSPHRNSPFWEDWFKRVKSIDTPSCVNLDMLTKNRTKIIYFRIFRIIN